MNISRIVLGLLLIVGAGGALVGGTGAFFSDTESSTGNSFTAGAIDLKVDNDSYYNGNRCTEVTAGIWQWQGDADFPEAGTPCTTSFGPSDLDEGKLFFDFRDVKPDDEGEDTISLHVQNDAWACMDMTLTSNDDISSTEPELGDGDVEEDINNTWDGELAQNIQMLWWADDGDNVFEDNEVPISEDVETLLDLATTTPFSVALADSENNVWDGQGPLPANTTMYIAKAWCFGTLTQTPVPAGQGVNPSVASGVQCDGENLNNLAQSDTVTLDIAFRTVQARHNPDFQCGGEDEQPRVATLTVIKEIVNDNGGNNVIADFQLTVDDGTVLTMVTSGVATQFSSDTYTVGETGISGYVASFSGDCDVNGVVTLNPGDNKTCTLTNNDLPANITLIKNVVNDDSGTAGPTQFGLRVDGALVQNNTSVAVNSNVAHSINEDGRAGYTFVSITGGAKCPAVLGGTATLDEGESLTCTITNNDNEPAQSLFFDGFGTGTTDSTFGEAPAWTEGGSGAEKRNAAGGDFASSNGGRFAAMSATSGFICQSINSTGFSNLVLSYIWRGDPDGDVGDLGIVEYATGGTCAAPTGLTTLTSHDLSDNTWDPNSINLPGSLDGTTFLIRFRNTANAAGEDFRVDAVSVTGN